MTDLHIGLVAPSATKISLISDVFGGLRVLKRPLSLLVSNQNQVRTVVRTREVMRSNRPFHSFCTARLDSVVQLDKNHFGVGKPFMAFAIREQLFLCAFNIELQNIDAARGMRLT